MNLASRIFSVLGTKAKGVANSAKGTFVSFFNSGGSRVTSRNLITNDKNWVYVATDKNAKTLASVRFKVMKTQGGKDVEVWNGPIYEFLNKPNPALTLRNFIYVESAFLQITGNAFWKIIRKGTKVEKIEPLNPLSVSPIRKDGVLIGYKYSTPDGVQTYSAEDILHDYIPSIADPYWGTGTLSRVAEWVDTDAYAAEFNRLFFVQGASFGGFIESDADSKERLELIKHGLVNSHTGVGNAHKYGVLPKGAKFSKAQASMTDMQFVELDDRYRDKILAAFGVPKAILGLTQGENRATAESAEYIYTKYTIKPHADAFVDFLNTRFVPLFDKTGQYFIAYEDFIPRNQEIDIKEAESALAKQAYMTINEVRETRGLPPVAGGDVVIQPSGTDSKPVVPQKSRRSMTLEKEPDTQTKSLADSLAEKMVDAITVATTKQEEPVETDPDIIAHKDFVARIEQYETQLTDKVRDFNQQQRGTVLLNLKTMVKSVKKGDVLDMPKEVSLMVDFVSPIMGALFREQMLREWEAQNFDGEAPTQSEKVKDIIDRAVNKLCEEYNDTTASLLKDAINEGLKENETIAQISSRVANVYEFSDLTRAVMVAKTETAYIANTASREAYIESGVVETVRWYTAEDERVCEFCGPMNGRVISVKEAFYKLGEEVTGKDGGKIKVDYRSVYTPPLHPNCRCLIRAESIKVKTVEPIVVEKIVEREVVREVEDESLIEALEEALND